MNTASTLEESLGFLGTWHWDARTGAFHASELLKQLFGICIERALATERMEDNEVQIHPDDVEWVRRERPRCFGPSGWGVVEYRVIDGAGATHWVECRARYRTDQHGTIEAADGMLFDVTAFIADGNAVRTAPAALPHPVQQTADALIRAHEAALQTGDGALVLAIEASLARAGRLLASEVADTDGIFVQ